MGTKLGSKMVERYAMSMGLILTVTLSFVFDLIISDSKNSEN